MTRMMIQSKDTAGDPFVGNRRLYGDSSRICNLRGPAVGGVATVTPTEERPRHIRPPLPRKRIMPRNELHQEQAK